MRHLPTSVPLLLAALLCLGQTSFAQKSEELLRKGSALVQASRHFEAEQVLKTIRPGDASFPAAATILGFVFLRRAALAEAQDALTQVLELQPENAEARYGLGLTLYLKGLIADAAMEFRKVPENTPVGVQAHVQFLQCQYLGGKEDDALNEAADRSRLHPDVVEYQALLGYFHQLRGKPEEALGPYRRVLALQPDRLQSYLNLVSIYRSTRDWNSALHLLKRALELDPNHPLLYQEMAYTYDRMGLNTEAATARDEMERTLNAEFLYVKATRARIDGFTTEADRLLRNCLEANPRLSKAWADLGELSRKDNRLDEAHACFQKAIEIDPSNRLARLGLAAILHEHTAEPDGAERHGKQHDPAADNSMLETQAALLLASRQSPLNPDLLLSLGYLYESGENSGEALRAYSDVLELNTLQVEAFLGKARSLVRLGDTRAALEAFRRATDLEPAEAPAWHGLIEIQRKSNDAAGARASSRDCISNLPLDSTCREQMANLELDAGKFEEAVRHFQWLLDHGITSKATLDGMGFALMKLGYPSRAIGLFERSLKDHGRDAWIYANLGYLHQIRGNVREAVANYERARGLSPGDANIHHSLGVALYLAGKHSKAVDSLREALRQRPDWGTAHLNLAMAYWNLHQYALALTHARFALEKGEPQAAQIVRALSSNLKLGAPRLVDMYRSKP